MIAIILAAALTSLTIDAVRPEGRAFEQPEAGPTFRSGDPASQKLVDMYVRNGIAELGLDATTAEGREKIARLTAAVREELEDRALIHAEARRRMLPIEAQFDARRQRWMARLGGDAGYRAYLAEHHLTDADFRQVIEQEIAAELLRAELTREIRVSDDEIAEFYNAGRSDPKFADLFVAPATVTASHILVAARRGLHADIDARRDKAARIRRDLLEGADFATLARQHSDDPGTRDRGGDLGSFTRETHTEAFDTAAFALAPGQISPVIQTEYGFHVIRVTAKTPHRIRSLEELRPAITERLKAQKSTRHLASWLQQQRTAARVAWTKQPSMEKQ